MPPKKQLLWKLSVEVHVDWYFKTIWKSIDNHALTFNPNSGTSLTPWLFQNTMPNSNRLLITCFTIFLSLNYTARTTLKTTLLWHGSKYRRDQCTSLRGKRGVSLTRVQQVLHWLKIVIAAMNKISSSNRSERTLAPAAGYNAPECLWNAAVSRKKQDIFILPF